MIVKLLTEHHLEFLSLKGGCTGSSQSTLVKMPNCYSSLLLEQQLDNRLKEYLIQSVSGTGGTNCMTVLHKTSHLD